MKLPAGTRLSQVPPTLIQRAIMRVVPEPMVAVSPRSYMTGPRDGPRGYTHRKSLLAYFAAPDIGALHIWGV